MARSDTETLDETPNMIRKQQEINMHTLLVSEDRTIHSGHFMLSRVHDGESENTDECVVIDDVDLSLLDKTREAYHFGPRNRQTLDIDASLTKLFDCMTLAYSGKITSPKWKPFKGMPLDVKDKVRLNNIIWREWHMQYIYGQFPVVCQFATPVSDEVHTRPEAVVLEGKYWKRRLDTVTAEYKRWRKYYKDQLSKFSVDLPTNELSFSTYAIPRSTHAATTEDLDLAGEDDFIMDFTNSLFTLGQPFAFPNTRELSQYGFADFIQPGLHQLQPNLEDFMDVDPLQDLLMTSRFQMPINQNSALLQSALQPDAKADQQPQTLQPTEAPPTASSSLGLTLNNTDLLSISSQQLGGAGGAIAPSLEQHTDQPVVDTSSFSPQTVAAIFSHYGPQIYQNQQPPALSEKVLATGISSQATGDNGRIAGPSVGQVLFSLDSVSDEKNINAIGVQLSQSNILAQINNVFSVDQQQPQNLSLQNQNYIVIAQQQQQQQRELHQAKSIPTNLSLSNKQATSELSQSKLLSSSSVPIIKDNSHQSLLLNHLRKPIVPPTSVCQTSAPSVPDTSTRPSISLPGLFKHKPIIASNGSRLSTSENQTPILQQSSALPCVSVVSPLKRETTFAMPKGKPLSRPKQRERPIAPAHMSPVNAAGMNHHTSSSTSSSSVPQQNTYLAQILTTGLYPGGLINIKQKSNQAASKPCLNITTTSPSPTVTVATTYMPIQPNLPSTVAPQLKLQQRSPPSLAAPIRPAPTIKLVHNPADVVANVLVAAAAANPAHHTSSTVVKNTVAISTTASSLVASSPVSQPFVTGSVTSSLTSVPQFSCKLSSPDSLRNSSSEAAILVESMDDSSFCFSQSSSIKFSDQIDESSMSPDHSPYSGAFQTGSPDRSMPDSERGHYREHRRVSHISSEQKRRCNIKSGFDMLHILIPSLSQNPNAKVSKAVMLQKTAEFCKKLKAERIHMQKEAEILKQEIESLNSAINVCQSQLPATGAPVTRQRVDKMNDIFEEYVKSRTLQNWKFWIFSIIIRSLFDSYNKMVSTASIDEICRTSLAWLDQHCSLVQLRPTVLNSLRHLSTSTSILSDPGRVPEQATRAVTKTEHRSPDIT